MNARLLLAVFDSIYVFALAAWVGGILFFSIAVVPILVRVLGADAGAKSVRALAPRYYAWGVGAAAVALPAMVCGPLSVPELRGPMVAVQAGLIVAGLGILLYCGNTLTPAIDAATDQGPASTDRVQRLRKRSVVLNVAALVIGVLLLVGFASRQTPRSPGIEEMTPQERVEYDREFAEALDQIVRGQSAREGGSTVPRPRRFGFDEAARKELEDLVEARRRKDRPGRP